MYSILRKPDDISSLIYKYVGLLEQEHEGTGPSTLVEFDLCYKRQVIGWAEELTVSPTILHISLRKALELVSTIVPMSEITSLEQTDVNTYMLCDEDNLVINIETSKV